MLHFENSCSMIFFCGLRKFLRKACKGVVYIFLTFMADCFCVFFALSQIFLVTHTYLIVLTYFYNNIKKFHSSNFNIRISVMGFLMYLKTGKAKKEIQNLVL